MRGWPSGNLADAAAFGFGASAGRDLWRWVKNDTAQALAFAVLLGAATLPVLSGRGMTEGHDRGPVATALKTVFGNALLLAAGLGLAWACLILPTWNDKDPQAGIAAALAYAALWCATLAVGGAAFGLARRPRRKRAFAVARHNREFLARTGIAETRASDASHVGPEGERLRLLGDDDGNVVFMVVGKRAKRAYISMDGSGRFLEYSGPRSV